MSSGRVLVGLSPPALAEEAAKRKRRTEAKAPLPDSSLEEVGEEEEENHDDYIREFSFEPELIVPKRTVSANSLTCYQTSPSGDSTHPPDERPQRPQRSHSNRSAEKSRGLLSKTRLPVTGASPLNESASVIPSPHSTQSVLVGQDSNVEPISLAGRTATGEDWDRKPVRRAAVFVVGEGEGRAEEDLLEITVDGGPVKEEAENKDCEGDGGGGRDLERTESGRKRSKSRGWWKRWCIEKDHASSADQVHHEIEAFYYVGTLGGRCRVWFPCPYC